MGKREKCAHLEAIRGRYRKSDRAGKAAILDEFCAICGFDRKYACGSWANRQGVLGANRVRSQSTGSPELLAILKTLWFGH